MTTSNIKFNNYKFLIFELVSYDFSTVYDLKEWFKEVRIYESMFASSIHVDVTIQDAENMLTSLPIIGQENVRIILASGANGNDIGIDLDLLKVYSVSDIKVVNETVEYVLRLVTEDFTSNFSNKISEHVSGSGSSIASYIFDDLESEKEITIEGSIDEQNLVIPNMTPLRCINWLATRSHNDTSTSYVFFENNRGYVFKSIESFFDNEIKYMYRGSGKNIKSYGTMEDQKEENRSLISYKVISRFDVIDNITKGMYTSSVISCDVVHRKVKKTTHSWYEDSENYRVENRRIKTPNGSGSPLYPLMSKTPHGRLKYEPDNVMLVPHNQLNKYNISDNILKYNYGNQLFNNLKMNIEVSGKTSLAVGDLLELEIPIKRPSSAVYLDNMYAGKWLIINITHIITRDSYIMSIDVVKDRIGLEL
jgi:hypothetical protein